MKRVLVEILIIVLISSIIAIIYNAFSQKPLPLIAKKIQENEKGNPALFDKNFVSQVKTLDSMISYSQIIKILDSPEFIIIDARNPEQFEKGHIGNSININPYMEQQVYMEKMVMLPRDKGIVCYCDGGTCDLSHEVAKELINMGFKRVFIYGGGWEEWSKKRK